MRLLPLLFIMLAGSLVAGETTAYPLWDGHESVAEYAKKVNMPATKTLDLGSGVKMELVLIPAGKFIMGMPEPNEPTETTTFGKAILVGCVTLTLVLFMVVFFRALRRRKRPTFTLRWLLVVTSVFSMAVYGGIRMQRAKSAWQSYEAATLRYARAGRFEKPSHAVSLTKPFYLGKFAVTQEQYQQIMAATPSAILGNDHPVDSILHADSIKFCKSVSKKVQETIRLPTEAEWEFACRAGTTTAYYSGDTEADLARIAWYSANSNKTSHPVGQKEPNAFGLYDMNGNVWQWCQDWFEENYYANSPAVDPRGPATGENCIARGGQWEEEPFACTSWFRNLPGEHDNNTCWGFRVVLEPAPK